MATLGLFYAVGRWNGISDVLYYINTSSLYTVQMVLKQFVEAVNVSVEEGMTIKSDSGEYQSGKYCDFYATDAHCLSVRTENFSPRVS